MKVSPLDEAELRSEFRRTIKEVGVLGSWQILYELLFSINVFMDIMREELRPKC